MKYFQWIHHFQIRVIQNEPCAQKCENDMQNDHENWRLPLSGLLYNNKTRSEVKTFRGHPSNYLPVFPPRS